MGRNNTDPKEKSKDGADVVEIQIAPVEAGEPIAITELNKQGNTSTVVEPDVEPVAEVVIGGGVPIEAATKAVTGPPENKAISGSIAAKTR